MVGKVVFTKIQKLGNIITLHCVGKPSCLTYSRVSNCKKNQERIELAQKTLLNEARESFFVKADWHVQYARSVLKKLYGNKKSAGPI